MNFFVVLFPSLPLLSFSSFHRSSDPSQKSEHRPLRSQSPNRVGSGNLPPLRGPPHSAAPCSKDGDAYASTNISSCSISSSSSESMSPQAATRTFSTFTPSAVAVAVADDAAVVVVDEWVSLLVLIPASNRATSGDVVSAFVVDFVGNSSVTKERMVEGENFGKTMMRRVNSGPVPWFMNESRVARVSIRFSPPSAHDDTKNSVQVRTLYAPPAILSSHDENAADRIAGDARVVLRTLLELYREAFALRSTCRKRLEVCISYSTRVCVSVPK